MDLIQQIWDWQADLLLDISNLDDLMAMPESHLREMLAFYEDTLKNGKRL